MRRLLMLAAVPILLALSAAPARAAFPFDTWTGLPGLNAANGANWVREYATGIPPTTIYAATEGGGVYKSDTDGLTWSKFSSGLDTVPGAMDVRTVYTSGLSTVWAGTTAGLFKSIGGGAFQPVAQGPEPDPAHPTKLNQAVQTVLSPVIGPTLAGVASGGVYTSNDGGATWQPPAAGNGMSRSETVWSLSQFAVLPGYVFAATGSGIYRSLDGGMTWTPSSDGISGTTLRVQVDAKRPEILYAAGTGGVFRSVTAGLTWSSVNGTGTKAMLGGQVRAMQQFSGNDETRLYVGAENGLWAGTSGHGLIPGPMTWRHVTTTGLIDATSTNTIFWALTNFTTTPGTLLAGTQSNGGYAMVLTPPSNTAAPVITGTKAVGATLAATSGVWKGTPTIDYEYQWQRCTSSAASSCTTDIPDATDSTYDLVAADQAKWVRVVVTASNDFPSFGLPAFVKESAVYGTIGAKPNTLPGDTQRSAASIQDIDGDNPSLPTSGDTLKAVNYSFTPPATTSTTFQWERCASSTLSTCHPLAGQTAITHVLTDDDVTYRLCVQVTGKNGSGSATLDCAATTNTIFPQPATNTGAPSLSPPLVDAQLVPLHIYPGDTVVSNVGSWKYPGTTYTRHWESCEADGSDCSTISGETGPAYVARAGDIGQRLRVRIDADSNEDNHFPDPVEVFTPESQVVEAVPVVQPTGGGGGGGGGGAGGGGGGGGGAATDVTPPALQAIGFKSAKVKSGGSLQLSYRLSEPGTLSVEIQRLLAGRKAGKKCKAGGKKGKKCTVAKSLGTVKLASGATALSTKLHGKKLPAGSYRAIVTPVDAAGNRGAGRTVSFTVKR
jgi:hypothetical protein